MKRERDGRVASTATFKQLSSSQSNARTKSPHASGSKSADIGNKSRSPMNTTRNIPGSGRRKSKYGQLDEDTSAKYASVIRPERFLSARWEELQAISEISTPPRHLIGPGRKAGQSLRRRAGSYRSYRLPYAVRSRPSKRRKLLIAGVATKFCRSQRRFRRLLTLKQGCEGADELNSSSARKIQWLETHLWHRKRMHMSEHWGFLLATRRCDTGVRAAKRWMREQCTLHDASYTSCLQLVGAEPNLTHLLQLCSCSLDPGGVAGGREIEIILFHPKKSPHGAISPAKLLFRPSTTAEASSANSTAPAVRTAWLWVHPSAKAEALSALSDLCATDFPQVTISDLSGELLRHELRGPKAHAILAALLCPVPAPASDQDVSQRQRRAWQMLLGDGWNVAAGEKGAEAVVVECQDPRLLHPPPQVRVRNTGSTALPQQPHAPTEAPGALCYKPWLQPPAVGTRPCGTYRWNRRLADGPLWEAAARREMDGCRAESVASLNDRRRRGLLHRLPSAPRRPRVSPPGVVTSEAYAGAGASGRRSAADGAVIESLWVMVIAQAGAGRYGSGWDLIVPRGWGDVLFQQMVLCGGRAIGLEERDALVLEAYAPHVTGQCTVGVFPRDFPDTAAGRSHAADRAARADACRRVLPPAVRVNYTRLGIQFPFPDATAWAAVAGSTEYYVLRGEAGRALLDGAAGGKDASMLVGSLVRVTLRMCGRGVPTERARICRPQAADYALVQRCRRVGKDREQANTGDDDDDDDDDDEDEDDEGYGGLPAGGADSSSHLAYMSKGGALLPLADGRVVLGYLTCGGHGARSGRGVGVGLVAAGDLRRLAQALLPLAPTIPNRHPCQSNHGSHGSISGRRVLVMLQAAESTSCRPAWARVMF